ncbi:MAG: ABC transporter transmembrane domain-containing protein, partial [Gemmatimonadota bacterium]|nr:ABC transporter transmembrane domain-containing protein [Gemmatimonadota bacterium]
VVPAMNDNKVFVFGEIETGEVLLGSAPRNLTEILAGQGGIDQVRANARGGCGRPRAKLLVCRLMRTPDGPLQEEEALGKAYDARLMRRLLRYLRPYRGKVVLAVLMLIAASGLALVGPWLTKVAIDDAIPAGDLAGLRNLALLFFGALFLSGLLEYARTILTTWIGQNVMLDLRKQIFGHLQRLSLAYFDRNPVGRLMTRLTSDVEVLNEMFTSGVVTIFGDIFTVGFIMVAMLVMDWRLALVTFTVLPAVFIAAWIFRRSVREAYRDIRVRLARINAFLQERISGIRVVQLYRQERPTRERFREINDDHLQAHLRSITYYALFFPVIEVLASIALALILWYGGIQSLEGTLTIGVIAAFLQYARRFFRPIQDLSEKYNILQGAMASSERIFRLLDEEPDIRDEPRVAALPATTRGRIAFEDVWFRYVTPEDEEGPAEPATGAGAVVWEGAEARLDAPPDADEGWVLRGIDFTVEPGQRLAFVGATGAGKTTLFNLLMRFYEPQRGRITLDGVDIRDYPLSDLRRQMGLVLQDVYLFSGSAAENISLDREAIGEDEVRAAAGQVGVDRHLARLPRAYDQPLGERGANLSVGERQLISFARALAGDPPILLLDEATSSVDSEIEAQIQAALERLMRGRTSLVIAHRLSTIRSADRILVLHHGRIHESGTHETLLERGGLYAQLHRLQFERPSAVA